MCKRTNPFADCIKGKLYKLPTKMSSLEKYWRKGAGELAAIDLSAKALNYDHVQIMCFSIFS